MPAQGWYREPLSSCGGGVVVEEEVAPAPSWEVVGEPGTLHGAWGGICQSCWVFRLGTVGEGRGAPAPTPLQWGVGLRFYQL